MPGLFWQDVLFCSYPPVTKLCSVVLLFNFVLIIKVIHSHWEYLGNSESKKFHNPEMLLFKFFFTQYFGVSFFFFFFPLMFSYKPFLVPTVLSTERRNSRFLSAPTAQAQQGGRTRGAGKSGICRAVGASFLPPPSLPPFLPLSL